MLTAAKAKKDAEGVNKDFQSENTQKCCLQCIVVTCLCKKD